VLRIDRWDVEAEIVVERHPLTIAQPGCRARGLATPSLRTSRSRMEG
jgi:hypothetical protein